MDAQAWLSAIDERFSVPGERRPALALQCARESIDDAGAQGSYDTPAWHALAELDAADGFATRRAARAVLRRSDGRFLIFRYPFHDGSLRFVIPGGGAEPGETAVEAVEREVFEETGASPRALRPSGVVLYHLLATTVHGGGRTPTIQYSPVYLGEIDDELPDTGGRAYHWYNAGEFAEQPRRPISDPILRMLAAADASAPATAAPEPHAVWLPA